MGGHGLLCPPHLRNMKRIFTLVLVLASIAVHAQTTDDPVVMTVNGIPVTRSEFAYSYNKNNTADVIDRKTVDEYVDLYMHVSTRWVRCEGNTSFTATSRCCLR